MKRNQIGIQLYTLREMAAKDFEATLARVAKIGYAGVEFAGFHGHSATDVRAMLDRYNLKAFSAHIGIDVFDNDIEQVVSDLQTVGAPWGVVPWVSPENRSPEFFTELGGKMNAYGSRLADAGLKLAYHNHDFEFSMTTDEGKTIFETLIEITDPALVSFELDLFWAAVGGYEPDAVMQQHADRIRLVHLKDGYELASGKDAPFGAGVMDWGAILSAAREIGVEYYITEQDNPNPENPIGDAETAYRNAERSADQ
jgi:sugar phosphate isomerase/epimerase